MRLQKQREAQMLIQPQPRRLPPPAVTCNQAAQIESIKAGFYEPPYHSCEYTRLRIGSGGSAVSASAAMAAKLTDRLWSWKELVEMMDADQPAKKRGPYKTRAST